MEVEESFPTLGGQYFLPGTQINSWLKCGTQSIVDKKTGALVFANDDGIVVLEKDCNYCPNDLRNRNRSMSRASITEENLNYSNKNLHVKQDQNWISKSFRKLSIASSTPPNLSSLNLNVKPETNIPEETSTPPAKGHSRNYSTSSTSSSQKEKNTLFQTIRFKMKKNNQYHSNDVLSSPHDEVSVKANRRCSNFGSVNKKDLEALVNGKKLRNSVTCKNFEAVDFKFDNDTSINNKKIINSDDYNPRCFRAGVMDNTISKNFAIVGQSVTHEYLPEMDIVCGYIQLEFDGEEKLIPVYAMLYDYELIFFENDKCKDELSKITIEGCSAYNEPKPKSKPEKSDKSENRKSKYDKAKSESVLRDIADIEDDKSKEQEDYSFNINTSQGTFKIHTINNSSMIRWMATINTASSNISLALHLSSQYQQNSESAFDQSDHALDIYNKEYIKLIRDFNYSKRDINKEIIKNTRNIEENRLPSPTVHGTPDELMNQNIPIIQVTNSKNGEYFDKDSIKARKKKNRISDLESRFKNIEIPEGHSSLENIDTSNFLDCTKLSSPIFNMDCVSMPTLNKDKENEEKEDTVGEINNISTKHCRPNRQNRLSNATITSVNSYNNRSFVEEEDIHFENNSEKGTSILNSIYCATQERLIECIYSGEETPDEKFLDTLIYTYRHFTTSDYIMDKLITKFQEKLPCNSNSLEEDDFLLWKPIIMIRIAHYIKRWLTLCSIDFRVVSVRLKLDSFINMLSNISVFENGEPLYAYMLYKDLSSLQTMFSRFSNEVLSYIDLSTKVENSKDKSKLPEFINLDATSVAYKLTSMESERFQNIKPIEFILNLWNTDDPSPYVQHEMEDLKKMVEASNHISYWVITEILTQRELKPRVKVLEMFIKIAHICKKLNNYQTLFSICSGLSHSQVTRLKMTWENIQPKYKNRFNELERITSIARNYNTYRQIHANLLEKDANTSQYIPFIALLIKDLYFFNDGNPKYIDESKLRSMKNEENNETTSMPGNETTSTNGNETIFIPGNEITSTTGNETILSGNETIFILENDSNNNNSISQADNKEGCSYLSASIKSENDTTSFLTASTSNNSLNHDFGLESIDEGDSISNFERDDGSVNSTATPESEDDVIDNTIPECKSEGELPTHLTTDNDIEKLTNKVLSIESTTSTVTITTTPASQMINYYKLKNIMEQIRKIEHCQKQSRNYSYHHSPIPVKDVELPRNYYQIINDDKRLNKYSLICEQREGQPLPMVQAWAKDNK